MADRELREQIVELHAQIFRMREQIFSMQERVRMQEEMVSLILGFVSLGTHVDDPVSAINDIESRVSPAEGHEHLEKDLKRFFDDARQMLDQIRTGA